MRILRLVAFLLGAGLMAGEAWRSYGADRPFAFWIDDQIMGALLIVSAALMSKDTTRRRGFFCAAWAANAGMLYQSFFEKVVSPDRVVGGNFAVSQLTLLIGVAFLVSIYGTVSAILQRRVL